MEIKDRIKELRKENKLTQKQLSEKINIAQSTISEWEKGSYEPTANAIKLLALFFNVTADYLLGLEDDTGTKIEIKNSYNVINNSGNINLK